MYIEQTTEQSRAQSARETIESAARQHDATVRKPAVIREHYGHDCEPPPWDENGETEV